MDEREGKVLTHLKSYIVYEENGHRCMLYAIGSVDHGECVFLFAVPGAGKYQWRMNTDFSLKISEIVCKGRNEIPVEVSDSEDGQECVAVFEVQNAQDIQIACEVESMSIRDTVQHLRSEYSNRLAHIEQLLQSERDLTAKVQSLNQEIQWITNERNDQESRYAQMAAEQDQLPHRVEPLLQERALLNQKVEDLRQENNILTIRKSDLETQLRNKEGHIELLLQADRELQRIYSSRSWRFMGYVWKIRDTLIPMGSKRRLIGKIFVKFIKHPVRFLRKCTPGRIKKFFTSVRRDGVEGTSLRLDDCLIGNTIHGMPLVIGTVDLNKAVSERTAADYEKIILPQWESPTVSIVIPVYNQFDYTYLCVKSILENSGDVSYEIIIGDDCSTDLTQNIDEIIEGLHTVRNPKNLRFLLNCNHAAEIARGKYVLFLNNDTQVQKNWLEPLVTLIESADDIGMVGSKLVYPDGRLQEAGGILWKDGSAWNYGNRQDPNQPEFNYVKQVDYISGAAIMLSTRLWNEIGGFDETFVPAYCEDSDLAFTVRSMGYRVMYQPKSVVVHFEGVSNGTDTSTGLKHYQVVNSEKFREKWAGELAKHPDNAVNVFQARDYSYGKKTVLVIDHYVPQFDQDAGSRTVFQYLKLLAENGFNVKFIGDNFYQHEPYTTVLQQMGVEVLYGPYYANNWKRWIRENAEHFDYVLLNRPHIAPKYLDFLRRNTKAKIMYYGHDLAFLREKREYEVTGDESFRKSSEQWQPKELALMRSADMAYYPSYVEVDEIHKIDPSIRVKAIPAYLFDDVQWEGYDFSSRKDVMFIGGFGHRPNVDAVKWLAEEIMPELVKRIPDIKVHILGSHAPQEVLDLADDNLIMEGFVTDEELYDFYHQCRIALVPLRYGAGIKGKVVEAMRNGTPVVTTSTGAEGIPNAEKSMLIEDNGKLLAEKLAALYNNKKALTVMSQNCIQYIQENYSADNAIAAIGPEFDM